MITAAVAAAQLYGFIPILIQEALMELATRRCRNICLVNTLHDWLSPTLTQVTIVPPRAPSLPKNGGGGIFKPP